MDYPDRNFSQLFTMDACSIEAAFPVFVPRAAIGNICQKKLGFHTKFYESHDGQALITYHLAGRNTQVTSLKNNDMFANL